MQKDVDDELALILKGYGRTSLEITYRLPDYPSVLQLFLWQFMDIFPEYPRLWRFLDFWEREIEGPIHSVRFNHQKLIRPGEWQNIQGEYLIQ